MSGLTDEQLQATYNSALKHGHLAAIKEVAKSVMLYVPTIPEGYALVPIEPTAAIIEAGLDYAGKGLCRNEAVGRIVTAWRFMLEAAEEVQS